MRLTSIFQLMKMRKENFFRKIKILREIKHFDDYGIKRNSIIVGCNSCKGLGYRNYTDFGYRAHGVEICECVEEVLYDAGTMWVHRNLARKRAWTGLFAGDSTTPMKTDSYVLWCNSCRQTYELIDDGFRMSINGKRLLMGGIHYHDLPRLGKAHINCPNCIQGAYTLPVITAKMDIR